MSPFINVIRFKDCTGQSSQTVYVWHPQLQIKAQWGIFSNAFIVRLMSTIQGCRHQLDVIDNEDNGDIASACECIFITYKFIYEFKQSFVLLSLPFMCGSLQNFGLWLCWSWYFVLVFHCKIPSAVLIFLPDARRPAVNSTQIQTIFWLSVIFNFS